MHLLIDLPVIAAVIYKREEIPADEGSRLGAERTWGLHALTALALAIASLLFNLPCHVYHLSSSPVEDSVEVHAADEDGSPSRSESPQKIDARRRSQVGGNMVLSRLKNLPT